LYCDLFYNIYLLSLGGVPTFEFMLESSCVEIIQFTIVDA
jgi:hypothetical protein